MRVSTTLVLSALLIGGHASAATIQVPQDQPTIQAGLDAASAGDVVLVAPGTYYEHITMIAAHSGIKLRAATDGAVVIDASFSGRGITATNLSADTEIRGLVIKNGLVFASEDGGGIWMRNSSPLLLNNVLENNRATVRGGGIFVDQGSPILEGNHVHHNTSVMHGGGIYLGSTTASLRENLIEHNSALGELAQVGGGGVAALGGTIEVVDNVFYRNAVGLVSGDPSQGGGIWIGSWQQPTSCTILRNLIIENASGNGGGVFFQGRGIGTIRENVIAGNGMVNGCCKYPGWGGGIAYDTDLAGAEGVVESNTIVGNVAATAGGVFARAPIAFRRNVVASNIGAHDSGGVYSNCFAVIECNDIWDNEPTDYGGCLATGIGFSEDPQFCNASAHDYGLLASSPCVDANGCGLVGALGPTCGTTSVEPQERMTWGTAKARYR